MKRTFRMDKALQLLVEICSLVSAALACLALLSWGLGHWRLGAFGANYVPMAPSTALAMLVVNIAAFLRSRRPDMLWSMGCCYVAAVAVALLGLLVLLQEPLGFELFLERWPARTAESIREIPVGRMSPLTAAIFVLAAGALLFKLSALHRHRLFNHFGNFLALLVLLTGLFIVLGYGSGTPLLYGGRTIPVALLSAISFFLTGTALLALGADSWLALLQAEGWPAPMTDARRRFDWYIPLAFLVLAAAIGASGFFYLRHQQAHARRTIYDELAAVAHLKVTQIVNWRKERLCDARMIQSTPFVADTVQRFLEDPSVQNARGPLLRWMTALHEQSGYSRVLLLDHDGQVRLAVPEMQTGLESQVTQEAAEVLRANEIVISDLHRSPTSQRIHMEWLVPLYAPVGLAGTGEAPCIAVILLEVDPHQFLYPLVQSWSTPSRTAETLLVRREGDDVVFLNELRHRANTALSLRFSVNEPDLPAAMAVRGREDVVEGLDYRKMPVLTAFGPVSGSPWFLVAKVDQEEIYTPLHRQALTVGSIVIVLLSAVALALGLIWRHRDAALLRRELAMEREHKVLAERFAHLMRHANDIILLADSQWRILEANDRAVESYGYSSTELQQMALPDLRAPQAQLEFSHQVEQLQTEDHALFETIHRRKDGSVFPVEISASIVQIGGETYKLGLLRDITQRRQAEEEILRLNEELEQRVIERTTRLEELNKELEAFSYSVSHDLRAPLRHISGYVDLLIRRCRDELSDKGRHYLDSITDSARQMGMLIDDLLQFSRTGRMEMCQSEMGMSQALQDALVPLLQEHSDRNIEWIVAALPDVYGDYAMLRLVWTNLLGNAVKYTRGREKAVIEVGWSEDAEDIVFYVRDNGVGFDMKYAHKLFGVFQRLHPTEAFEGTGIGLANVRRIILRHGGRTWAEAEVDKGATFYFTMPKRKEKGL